MIDNILKISRASLRSPPSDIYYLHFNKLLKFAQENYPDLKLPKIKIVYSLNKLCETFIYNDDTYIVYDQYLGQSFNKFNRLLYHESTEEAKSYLCKLMGEEFYLNNDKDACIRYLTVYHINSQAKASSIPVDILIKKTILITVQEAFAFFHELAHVIIGSYPQLKQNTNNFLNFNDDVKFIANIIQSIFNNDNNQNKFNHFIEELTCDFVALELTYKYFELNKKINRELIVEGICIAFLYLRSLYDIKFKVSGVKLSGQNEASRFRYNLLRNYFDFKFENDGLIALANIEAYELWEKKIDMPMVLFLDNDLKNTLTVNIKKTKEMFNESNLYQMLGL